MSSPGSSNRLAGGTLLLLALTTPVLAQTAVDSNGNVTASASLNAKAVVGGTSATASDGGNPLGLERYRPAGLLSQRRRFKTIKETWKMNQLTRRALLHGLAALAASALALHGQTLNVLHSFGHNDLGYSPEVALPSGLMASYTERSRLGAPIILASYTNSLPQACRVAREPR